MIHISHAHIEGYKSIFDTKVDFSPGLNIIIGKNGAGKTNLIKVLFGVLNPAELTVYVKDVDIDLRDQSNRAHWYSLRYDGMKPMHQIPENWGFYKVTEVPKLPDSSSENNSKLASDLVLIDHSVPSDMPFLDSPISLFVGPSKIELSWLMEQLLNPKIPQFSKLSFGAIFLLFSQNYDESLFRKSSLETKIRSFFESALGIGFPLMDQLTAYSPINDVRINLSIAGLDDESATIKLNNIQYEFQIDKKWYNFKELSDGVKRLVYIMFSVGMPRPFFNSKENEIEIHADLVQKIIFLEEPELGIHPHQLHKLLLFLKEQAETHQIILTTHSPQVLDILDKDELDRIIIADYSSEKGSQFRHLGEEQKEKALIYMEDMFLSDYWRHSDLETSPAK